MEWRLTGGAKDEKASIRTLPKPHKGPEGTPPPGPPGFRRYGVTTKRQNFFGAPVGKV